MSGIPTIEAVELRRVSLPLLAPFRTSAGVERERRAVVLRVLGGGAEGWAECVAMTEPLYTSEYADGAAHVLRHHLVPRMLGKPLQAKDIVTALAAVKGHPMAKAALELAVLDAELRLEQRSLAARLGATRTTVPAGISLGIADDLDALLDEVEGAVTAGYARVKLKVRPGWDVEPVAAVRDRFGPDLLLQVDANGAYAALGVAASADALARLDEHDLLLVEQPLDDDDLRGHADLARCIRTPVCLDEAITSARVAAEAIELGACRVVNVKPGRVGGHLEAVRIHDLCVAAGVDAWVGGMLETGLGRAANLALAALPGFTLPGDLSASGRYYAEDITEPFELEDGTLRVPQGPGIGVTPLPDVLARRSSAIELLRT